MSDNFTILDVIFIDGKVAQEASPKELYEFPTSKEVASFIGEMNFVNGNLVENKSFTVMILNFMKISTNQQQLK